MGEAPGGTPGPQRWGSARRTARAGGHRAGQPFDLSKAHRTKKGKTSEGRLVFLSLDLREGVAGGARKDPEAAVTQPRSSNGASRGRAGVGSRKEKYIWHGRSAVKK